MNWQVHLGGRTYKVELPDMLLDDAPMAVKLDGKRVWVRWQKATRSLSVVDNSNNHVGKECMLRARSASLQSFAGEPQTHVHLEYTGAGSGLMQSVDANVSLDMAGVESRGGTAAIKTVNLRSPMTGKILQVLVKNGDKVESGQPLVVIEAMKMENKIVAPRGGVITGLKGKEQAAVAVGETLLTIK